MDPHDGSKVKKNVPLRQNLLSIEKEHWKPPVYPNNPKFFQKIRISLFRYLDLQLGTIWRDLSKVLPNVRGTVLDAGCGIQPFRPMFSSEVRYIGLDTV